MSLCDPGDHPTYSPLPGTFSKSLFCASRICQQSSLSLTNCCWRRHRHCVRQLPVDGLVEDGWVLDYCCRHRQCREGDGKEDTRMVHCFYCGWSQLKMGTVSWLADVSLHLWWKSTHLLPGYDKDFQGTRSWLRTLSCKHTVVQNSLYKTTCTMTLALVLTRTSVSDIDCSVMILDMLTTFFVLLFPQLLHRRRLCSLFFVMSD